MFVTDTGQTVSATSAFELRRKLWLLQLRRWFFSTPTDTPVRKPRGFAAIDPARRRAIAAMGGKAAHAKGTAHRWTPESASVAGRLGGLQKARRSVVAS